MPMIHVVGEDSIESLKDRIKISQLAASLFPGWKAAKSCLSPFRDERTASFSVYADGKRWKDFATGEGGDVIDFLCRARGYATKDAIRELREMLGGSAPPVVKASPSIKVEPAEHATAPHVPDLRKPRKQELERLSSLRSIAIEPLKIAVERGFLWSTTLRDTGESSVDAWCITDSARKVFSARRYDGRLWDRIGGKKAYTLAGGTNRWPIGILEAQSFGSIALCEGAPDFLSAFAHAWASGVENKIAPVCMLAASAHIDIDALPHFRGKRVRIFVHNDKSKAGITAANRWKNQIAHMASRIDGFAFGGVRTSSGEPVKDLNHLLRIDYQDWESNKTQIENVMNFSDQNL